MAEYMGMNPPGLRVCRVSNPPLRERKSPPWGEKNVWEPGKNTPAKPGNPPQGFIVQP
jgi:hypothetical protein